MELGRSMMSAGAGAARATESSTRQQIGKSAAARAIDDVGWRRRCASYGVIDTTTDRKICSINSAALTALAALTRARGERRFQRAVRPSCAEQTDRLEPAVRLWSTSLGRSMMSAGAGAARATGSSTTDRKICSINSGGAYSRSRSRCGGAALNDHKKLAGLT